MAKWSFSAIDDLIHDKKIKPLFWIITIVYFLLAGYIILSSDTNGYHYAKGIAYLLIIPYFIFAVVYILYVHRRDK